MQKDFQKWAETKVGLHNSQTKRFFYEKEVWWCSLGVNIGYEEDGKNSFFTRPVLILRKFNKDMFIGVPLSTTEKEGQYHYRFPFLTGYSTALLSQIRLLDSKRLANKMGSISKEELGKIRQLVKGVV
ncbi:MAG: type II toxin-antitoxin system PemK/MazF family toxin [Patescibacteria group bacterium]